MKKTEASYKFACEFCGRRCKTSRGLKIHQAACAKRHGLTEEVFTVSKINAVFGTPADRWYRVAWQGYTGEDSWEPERSLQKQGCQDAIEAFWARSHLDRHCDFIPDPDGVWRCWTCGNGYKTASSLKAHITRKHSERCWHGSSADKDTRNDMRKQQQKKREQVLCEDEEIENIWSCKYLGSRFRADGDQYSDITARIAAATATAGKMRNIWSSNSIPQRLKLRIYITGVCSRLVYGSEAWKLDAKACAMINGANSRLISRITQKTPHEEASRRTRTFDVVRWIRSRRLQWVGHILRMCPSRMVHKAAKYIHEHKSEGDLLMDVPVGYSWTELM